MTKEAYLVLADGTRFAGQSFGARGAATGEAVFTTGMTGYEEVLTDPSYCGQIVTMTAPQIGNTGINAEDAGTSIRGRPFMARESRMPPVDSRDGVLQYLHPLPVALHCLLISSCFVLLLIPKTMQRVKQSGYPGISMQMLLAGNTTAIERPRRRRRIQPDPIKNRAAVGQRGPSKS